MVKNAIIVIYYIKENGFSMVSLQPHHLATPDHP